MFLFTNEKIAQIREKLLQRKHLTNIPEESAYSTTAHYTHNGGKSVPLCGLCVVLLGILMFLQFVSSDFQWTFSDVAFVMKSEL